MKKFTQQKAEAFIIDFLLSHRYIGHKQTTLENLVRYVPSDDKKIVEDALLNLIRKGFLFRKKKHYGIHISIFPKRIQELRKYLENTEAKK